MDSGAMTDMRWREQNTLQKEALPRSLDGAVDRLLRTSAPADRWRSLANVWRKFFTLTLPPLALALLPLQVSTVRLNVR